MPDHAPASLEVLCCVCGQLWDARDPGIAYRSLDRRWQCADGHACLAWARRAVLLHASLERSPRTSTEDMARMWAALAESWAALWARMGWDDE